MFRSTAQPQEPASVEQAQLDRVTEQINPTAFSGTPTQEDQLWGRTASGNEEDFLWRRLSDNFYQKDVIPSTYLQIHNDCYEAFNANPLASAIIEITTSFVLGRGLTISAANPRVQKVLDDFWNDPSNKMDERVYLICTELALYGEQFIRFFVNQYDGTVVVRQIDPSVIDQIETDPEDIEKLLRVHRRPIGQVMSATSGDPQHFDPSHAPTEAETEGEWFSCQPKGNTGPEVLQFAINKVSNAKRGKSDLATLLPWLRRYKDWLTDRVRINKYKGAFLYDVTLRGADKKTIASKQMDYGYPPEPGSVIIHNDAETWAAVEPKINAGDASEDGRQIKLMVALGAIIPEHYLSDGSNGNRATAAEMGLPTLLKFQRRQKVMRYILTAILDRVIDEARKAGKFGNKVPKNAAYEIIFPEIDAEDIGLVGQALSYVTQALALAKAQGWISDETAMTLMYKSFNQEVNVHEELDRIRAMATTQAGAMTNEHF